jgi:hypothetical protein
MTDIAANMLIAVAGPGPDEGVRECMDAVELSSAMTDIATNMLIAVAVVRVKQLLPWVMGETAGVADFGGTNDHALHMS